MLRRVVAASDGASVELIHFQDCSGGNVRASCGKDFPLRVKTGGQRNDRATSGLPQTADIAALLRVFS